jgi:hypothetical protein
MGWALLGALVLSSLGWSAAASAQPWTGERWVRGRAHRVEGEGALFVRGDTYAFSPGLHARFRLVDEHPLARDAFIVDLDLAWRGIGIAGQSDSFRLGNPYVGLRLGHRDTNWVARGGIGTTAPVTNVFSDGPDDHRAYQLGQAVHGGWDAWLLEPEIQPLILRGDFEIHDRWVIGGFDAALAVVFPLRNGGGGDTELAFQTGGFGGVDELQLALIPFFRVDLEPVLFELRLFMNLDRPFGFAFEDRALSVWSASLTVGGRFLAATLRSSALV